MNNYPKLTIIWRGCPSELAEIKQFRPGWFSKISCLRSVIKEFGDKPNCEIIGVWDGPTTNELHDLAAANFSLFYNTNLGNINSLIYCYELAKNIQSDLIYFIEDDYLFLPGSWEITLDMLQYSPIATLYDHQDRYDSYISKTDISYQHEFIIDGLIPYRTAESTTCSVSTRKDFFIIYYHKFIEFAAKGVGSPDDRGLFRDFIRNGYRLITPILKDSKSAHLVNGCFTNKVDWEYYSKFYLEGADFSKGGRWV